MRHDFVDVGVCAVLSIRDDADTGSEALRIDLLAIKCRLAPVLVHFDTSDSYPRHSEQVTEQKLFDRVSEKKGSS